MGIPRTLIETGPEAVAEYHVHIETARARGALNTLLAVPRTPATALADALHDLHDPNGAIDLDARLGHLASRAPEGTAFLVGQADQVWAFPSGDVKIELWRNDEPVSLHEPQVLRLESGDEIVLSLKDSGVELGRLRARPDYSVPAAPHAGSGNGAADDIPAVEPLSRSRARVNVRGVVAGVAVVAMVLAGVKFYQGRSTEPRVDAHVAPSLEERVVGFLTHGGEQSRNASTRSDATEENGSVATNGELPPEGIELAVLTETPVAADALTATVAAGSRASDAVAEVLEPWEFQASGAITSSPLLVDGQILFGSRDAHLYCLDAATGDLLWSLPTSSGVGSSPCSQDGRVFVGTYDGRVLGVSRATGAVEWEGTTGGRIVSSPCIVNDLVVVGSYDGAVHAFRHATGERAWKFAAGSVVRASPEPAGAHGIVVGTSGGRVLHLDTTDGSLRWEHTLPTAVHAQARWDAGRDCVYVGSLDGSLTRFPMDGGDAEWTIRLGSEINAQPRLADESVLVGTGKGRLLALDPANGETLWSTEAARGFDACPLVLGERVLAPSYDGTLHVLNLADGSQLERQDVGSEVFASPTSGQGLVYLGTMGGTLRALALP